MLEEFNALPGKQLKLHRKHSRTNDPPDKTRSRIYAPFTLASKENCS